MLDRRASLITDTKNYYTILVNKNSARQARFPISFVSWEAETSAERMGGKGVAVARPFPIRDRIIFSRKMLKAPRKWRLDSGCFLTFLGSDQKIDKKPKNFAQNSRGSSRPENFAWSPCRRDRAESRGSRWLRKGIPEGKCFSKKKSCGKCLPQTFSDFFSENGQKCVFRFL